MIGQILFDLAALASVLILAVAAMRLIVGGLRQVLATIAADPAAATSALIVVIAAAVFAAWLRHRSSTL